MINRYRIYSLNRFVQFILENCLLFDLTMPLFLLYTWLLPCSLNLNKGIGIVFNFTLEKELFLQIL